MRMLLAGLILTLAGGAVAAPQSLDELLEHVRRERGAERQEMAERERRFQEAREQQAALLEQARQTLAREEQRSEALRLSYEDNGRRIDEQQAILAESMGALGELQGVVRQVASDLKGILETSMISAQLPGRTALPDTLSRRAELASIEEMEQLWHLLLEEMVQTGKVVRFPAPVITPEGEERTEEVTRVGPFSAVTGGQYLRYLPETGRLIIPRRQPPLRFQAMAANLEQAETGVQPMAVDPTRGQMLALLVQTPDLRARVEQGGIIGYIILGLGVLALLIALERFAVLGWIGRRVKRQLKSTEPDPRNPLGRIMAAHKANPGLDAETLGLKLEEAILKEIPSIQSGLAALAMLAAIAPLLGLLGTVTGMIETFQAITLFGTGDPRLMSGGISQALVTTVLGLAVAIPILLLHSFLTSRSNRLVHILDEQSAAIVARMAETRNAPAV